MLAGTFRIPLDADLFGFRIPALAINFGEATHGLFEQAHELIAYLLAALSVAHIAGALRHHFIKGNNVLRRML